MKRGAHVALALFALACSEPPPTSSPPISTATPDGIRVTVGGREVVVHCALTCPATETELTRLSNDCLGAPTSGPHRVATGGAVLTLGCCQEATLAYDRACGHEGLPGCSQRWASRCEGVAPRTELAIPDEERGVGGTRGVGGR